MALIGRLPLRARLLLAGLAPLLLSPGHAVDFPEDASLSYMPSEVVVRARPSGRAKFQALGRPAHPGESEAVAKMRGMGCRGARPAFPGERVDSEAGDVFVVELDPGTGVPEAVESLLADADVLYAEPNLVYRVQLPLPSEPLLPSDPFVTRNGVDWSEGAFGQSFPDLWGLRDSRVIEAWNVFDRDGSGAFEAGERRPGEGVVVAVVDTGVDLLHPDLASAIWRNPGEIPANGVDDDGNGFIDDVVGWDFVGGDADPSDGFGHGTHVAGTVAARMDGSGVVGVAPFASVMVVKGLSDDGLGSSVDLANAVRYAADNGAHIMSNSWGGPRASQILGEAFAFAQERGVISVAAAGNSANNVDGIAPASLPGVVAVAALDPDQMPAFFSNVGSRIDISAPGVQILSTSANASDHAIARRAPDRVVDGDYLYLNGTSMACPHVSGALALLLSNDPGADPLELVGRLLGGAPWKWSPVPSCGDWSIRCPAWSRERAARSSCSSSIAGCRSMGSWQSWSPWIRACA
jgi:subtilisin family serine protease